MKRYKKEILRVGKWVHPAAPKGVLEVTQDMLETLKNNFAKTPFAPILRGHVSNLEAEKDPSLIVNKNISGLEVADGKLYAMMDVDEKELDKYNDVSVSIDPDYQDKETGKIIGPVLRHVAMVVNPYIKGMQGFMALSEENRNYLINLSEIVDMAKTVEPIKEEVKLEESTVVEEAVETQPEEVVTPEEVSEETTEKVEETPAVEAEVVQDAPVEESAEVVEEAPVEEKVESEEEKTEGEQGETSEDLAEKLAKMSLELAEANKKLAVKSSEERFNVLLSEGKVTPAIKDEFIQLHAGLNGAIDLADINLSDTLVSIFDKLPKVVNLEEQGTQPVEEKESEELKIKLELRELPVHAKKSAEEFEAWFEKNKQTILKASQEVGNK